MKPLPRYELKYWAQPEEAQALLAELRPHLEPDPHLPEGRTAYTVTSLYFDTPALDGVFEKVEGLRVRRKVRLRRYDTAADGWAELKAKRGRRIRKWRVPLGAGDLAALARGDLEPLERAGREGAHAASKLLAELRIRPLQPSAITRYEREAWQLAVDPTVRVTFDRALAGCVDDLPAAFLAPEASQVPMRRPPLEAPVILEVKVSGPVPAPVALALRRARLPRERISKYCIVVAAARGLALRPGGQEGSSWRS